MNHNDKDEYRAIYKSLWIMYRGDQPINAEAAWGFFDIIKELSIQEFRHSVYIHKREGRFFPTPADIFGHLKGNIPNQDQTLADARSPKTPFGTLSRIKIGSWNLSNLDEFTLRQMAKDCIDLVPEWRKKGEEGRHSDHQIATMIKYNVDPLGPFHEGVSRPVATDEMREQVRLITLEQKNEQ